MRSFALRKAAYRIVFCRLLQRKRRPSATVLTASVLQVRSIVGCKRRASALI